MEYFLKKQPYVSVIIPVYNAAPYLSECLQSIQKQTLQEIEILCVNDGSSDDSLKILKEFQANDSRIIVLDQENQGVAFARNRAIASATGEFIAFLDADDWLPDEKVYEDLYYAAIKNDVLLCGGSFMERNLDGSLITSWKGSAEKFVFAEDGRWSFRQYQYDLGFYRFIFNRRFVVQEKIFFPILIAFEDPVFFVQVMHKAESFYALKRVTYCYRKGHHSYELRFRQAEDLLTGIIYNIKLAQENDYGILLELQKERLCKTYIRRGLGRCLAEDLSGRLKDKFTEINYLLNNKSGIEYEAFQYYVDIQARRIAHLETKVRKQDALLRNSYDKVEKNRILGQEKRGAITISDKTISKITEMANDRECVFWGVHKGKLEELKKQGIEIQKVFTGNKMLLNQPDNSLFHYQLLKGQANKYFIIFPFWFKEKKQENFYIKTLRELGYTDKDWFSLSPVITCNRNS